MIDERGAETEGHHAATAQPAGRPARYTMDDVRARTYKARDAWWTVLLVDPLAGRLVRLVANRTSLTPDQLSVGALVLGMGAAGCFAAADWRWLALGAVLYHFSFVLDCMDGKVARLKGTGTVFGGWLDYVFDRIRVLICAFALTTGQFAATGRPVYLYLTVAIVFLDMLRYLDALKVAAVRREMRARLRQAYRPAVPDLGTAGIGPAAVDGSAAAAPPGVRPLPEHPDDAEQPVIEAVDLQQGFRTRFSWYLRVRDRLIRRRIRPHLISGIEFQMAVFVVGPLCDAIIPVTIGASALLLTFEIAIVYKLWLSTKDFARLLRGIERRAADAEALRAG